MTSSNSSWARIWTSRRWRTSGKRPGATAPAALTAASQPVRKVWILVARAGSWPPGITRSRRRTSWTRSGSWTTRIWISYLKHRVNWQNILFNNIFICMAANYLRLYCFLCQFVYMRSDCWSRLFPNKNNLVNYCNYNQQTNVVSNWLFLIKMFLTERWQDFCIFTVDERESENSINMN